MGPDGALWFTDSQGGIARIIAAGHFGSQFAFPGGAASGGAIATGPDGRIWFTGTRAAGDVAAARAPLCAVQ